MATAGFGNLIDKLQHNNAIYRLYNKCSDRTLEVKLLGNYRQNDRPIDRPISQPTDGQTVSYGSFTIIWCGSISVADFYLMSFLSLFCSVTCGCDGHTIVIWTYLHSYELEKQVDEDIFIFVHKIIPYDIKIRIITSIRIVTLINRDIALR